MEIQLKAKPVNQPAKCLVNNLWQQVSIIKVSEGGGRGRKLSGWQEPREIAALAEFQVEVTRSLGWRTYPSHKNQPKPVSAC